MLAQGYSVGRVEEMPRSSAAGKLLVRQLVRIYTPGTAVEGLMAVSNSSSQHNVKPASAVGTTPVQHSKAASGMCMGTAGVVPLKHGIVC